MTPELANVAPKALDELLLALINSRVFKKQEILQKIVLR
jgi:hypothetical protein